MAAPNPRKKARTAKPARAGLGRKRASPPAKKALGTERRPPRQAAVTAIIAPTWHARTEAFRAGWGAHLANLQMVEHFTVGEVTVGVAACRAPRPHWLYVTTGLWPRSVELCLKVPRWTEEPSPPAWASGAFRTLVGIAASPEGPSLTEAQVVTLGVPFAPGSELTSFAFIDEPTLGAVVTPYDSVKPLLAVGLTRDEERIVREWSPTALLAVLGQTDPLLATDLERSSLLLSPRARTHIERRVEREGSSLSVMWAARSSLVVQAQSSTWSLSADAVETFVSLLKGRIGHHRGFAVHAAGSATVDVAPADRPSLVAVGASSRIELSQPAARQLRAVLRPKEGRYAIDSLPELIIEVVA